MKILNTIYDYWEYIFIVIMLVIVWPILWPWPSTISPQFNNLNIIMWLISLLILVALFDGERRANKKRKRDTWASDGYELAKNITSGHKKLKRISIDTLAWIVFLVVFIVFFIWLVVVA